MYFYMSNKKSAVIGRANLGNKPNYNAFDLSHRNLFTTSTGVLRPVQYAELLPGEKFSVSESHFTRAQMRACLSTDESLLEHSRIHNSSHTT